MKLKYLLAASAVSLTAAATGLAVPAVAQQITSSIQGTVLDSSGNPVAGATVVVTDTRTGVSRTLVTGANGTFVAPNLVAGGPYTVDANADGLEGQTVNDIQTSLQGATDLTFRLASGGGAIVVTGSRVALTQLAIGPGTSFGTEVLENTPSFNRDIRDVIRLDPRVSLDRDDGGAGQDRISCLGGNDRGNAFTVDGTSQGDVYGLNDTGFSSRSSTPIPYDAVRETQVQFAPFDVDYGNFTGCSINVITKSGGNRIGFGGFFEYSDNSMRGKSIEDRGNTLSTAPIEPEKRYGVYFSGPIIKDRIFLFGAYEHQEAGQPQDEGPAGGGFPNPITQVTVDQFNEISQVLRDTYGVDTGPIATTRGFTNDRYFLRGDVQITDDHRLELTYQKLDEASTRADDMSSTGDFAGTVVGLNTFYLSGTQSNYYSGRLYSQWTDNFSTEVRYSRSNVRDVQNPIGGGEAQSDNPIYRIVVGVPNGPGNADNGAVLAGPGFNRTANDLNTEVDQYRLAALLDAGSHKFKFGVEMNYAALNNLFLPGATGTLVFRNIDDLRAGLLSPGTGNFDTFTSPSNVVNGVSEGAFGNYTATGDPADARAIFNRTIYTAFAQDEWDVSDRLTLTGGIRVDWYDGSHPRVNPNFVERYGFANNTSFSNIDPVFMPRLGFSYDVPDFSVLSRTQLRGGVGIFSGGDPLVWFGNVFQNDGYYFASGTTQNCAGGGTFDVVTGGTFTGIPQCVVDSGISRAADGLGDTQSINPNLVQPTVVRANIGLETDLNFADAGVLSGWHVNADFIYSKYRNPLSLVDLAATIDFRKGLNGFTVDGRPIYQSIDPTANNCDAELVSIDPKPVYSGVTAACFSTSRDDELMLTNGRDYESKILSFLLSKDFGGVFTENGSFDFSLGYAYTDAQDNRNMYRSTAGSNYDGVALFDRQDPTPSRGFFASKHNIVVRTSWKEEFFDGLKTRLGLNFVARSGRPYSLTFSNSGVFGDSASGSNNALVYIPTGVTDPNISPLSNMTAVQALVDWAKTQPCARDYIGRTIERNTCSGDWYYDLDLSFSQEIPGPGRFFGRDDKIKLYATVDNFLNLLNKSWNVQRRRDFQGLQDIADLYRGTSGFTAAAGVDSSGRYRISDFAGAAAIDADNQVNFSSSVWRLKIGLSYDF